MVLFVRTNQMLCTAFIKLLSKKKFEDITVNELCEKALIRRATFYTHFLDKYDFFAYFVRQNRDNFISTWEIHDTDNTLMAFSIQIRVSFIEELSKDNFATLPENVLPELAAAYYSGGIIQILRYWITSKGTPTEEVLVKQYSALLGTLFVS